MVKFYETEVDSRLMLGTALYPSPSIMAGAFKVSGAGIATVSLRRESGHDKAGQDFWSLVSGMGVKILPNTAGCHTVKEAVTTAHMAREIFGTPWIKLEVIGHTDTLQPDVFALVEAAKVLSDEGFEVFPYTTEDLIVADKLLNAGCRVLMPWGAPIGSGLGLSNIQGLKAIRAQFADVPMVIDAGIGLPSHAAQAMEMGFDAVLLNTAVAKAGDPAQMALAMARAVEAGRTGYEADPMEPRDMASPSTPLIGKAFLE